MNYIELTDLGYHTDFPGSILRIGTATRVASLTVFQVLRSTQTEQPWGGNRCSAFASCYGQTMLQVTKVNNSTPT